MKGQEAIEGGQAVLDEEVRPGYYKDKNGIWQKDRRGGGVDRRKRHIAFNHHDRRQFYRRKTDEIILEREAKQEIDDALEDFAAEHPNGHSQ